MAWTAPETWVPEQLVTAANLNAHLRDNMLILKVALADSGKISALSTGTLANMSGTSLTGVAKTAAASTYTVGVQNFNGGATVRVVLPVGSDKWAV